MESGCLINYIMQILSIEQIKAQYPDEWVLVGLDEAEQTRPQKGTVLLHGKDYLELCYKGSEIAKNTLTTILFTGAPVKKRKWVKVNRLQ